MQRELVLSRDELPGRLSNPNCLNHKHMYMWVTLRGLSKLYVHIYTYNKIKEDVESLRVSRGHKGGAEERKKEWHLSKQSAYIWSS